MQEKKFCKGCGRLINILPFGIGEKYVEFDDGYYCESCAKIMVEKRRKKI